jgi:hypothetical protein
MMMKEEEEEEREIVLTVGTTTEVDGKIESTTTPPLVVPVTPVAAVVVPTLVECVTPNSVVEGLKVTLYDRWNNAQPWRTMFDTTRMERPESISHAWERIHRNVPYFEHNYMLISAALSLFTIFTSPNLLMFFLVIAAIYFYAIRYNPSTWVVFGKEIGRSEKIAVLSAVALMGSLFLTPSLSTFFNTLLFFVIFVIVHSALWVNHQIERPFEQSIEKS